MRVLHVIAAVAPRYGGPSVAVLGIVSAMRRHGIEAEVATTDADGSSRLPVACDGVVEWQEVPIRFFPKQWSESLKYSRPLGRWVASHAAAYDVLHVHGVFSHSTLAAAAAARRAGVPYVLRTMGHLDPWSLGQARSRKALFLATMGRRLVPDAAALHFTTEAERESAGGFGAAGRSVVVPLGVNEPAGEESRPATFPDGWGEPGFPFALFVGRLHPKKGLETLIDGVLGVPEARLVIAGDGDDRYVRSLRARAEDAAGRIEFLGWLGPVEKAWVHRRAALFALLSHSENFGMAVAEAMAAGVPAFVSSAVNISAAIRDAEAGWVVDPDGPFWRETFRMAFCDGRDREARGERARRLALDRWSWSGTALRLAELYESVAAGRKAAA